MGAIFWRKRYFFSHEEMIDNTMIMEELAGEIGLKVNNLHYQNHEQLIYRCTTKTVDACLHESSGSLST